VTLRIVGATFGVKDSQHPREVGKANLLPVINTCDILDKTPD
jgi:hypothetical protein